MTEVLAHFDVDANGILTVSAKDLDTGKQQSITITDNGKMSDEEIEKAMQDAATHATADHTYRDALALVSEVNVLEYKVRNALAKVSKRLDKDEKKRVKDACANLSKLVTKAKPEKMTQSDLAAIKDAKVLLEQVSVQVCRLADEPEPQKEKKHKKDRT